MLSVACTLTMCPYLIQAKLEWPRVVTSPPSFAQMRTLGAAIRWSREERTRVIAQRHGRPFAAQGAQCDSRQSNNSTRPWCSRRARMGCLGCAAASSWRRAALSPIRRHYWLLSKRDARRLPTYCFSPRSCLVFFSGVRSPPATEYYYLLLPPPS